jgi:glycogen operon protein
MNTSTIAPGCPWPLGSTPDGRGVNFAVYSRDATGLDILLFDDADDEQPSRIIPLDPALHRTFHYWHAYVPGLRAGQIYGYRAHGPYRPEAGLRFDPDKLLLDPYGRAVARGRHYDRLATIRPGVDYGKSLKSVVIDPAGYDWGNDRHPRHPFSRTLIYEMHLKGFTVHPSSGVSDGKRGTYAGLIEKIPYLKDLGITAVELLPVFHFDEQDAPGGRPNYWGYAPVSFFAPHLAYSSVQTPQGAIDEFRDMVKALHAADLEVILDVVYNHTAEGDQRGPTFCFKGLANSVYYIPGSAPGSYANYTGTGNTFNANHPVVRRLIRDSLKYWVREMHVDGFRFDLASILSRDETGCPVENPPILWDIETDPVLAGTKLIAEAWDAGGLYQVGSFVGDRWKEWNGRFRDDIRSFFKGEPGTVARLPDRLFGSPDLYGHQETEPEQSINFVTCHDGFTLNDLVSYDHKHNLANGEDNRDGADDNRSWNCGVEGPTDDPAIERLRLRQIKNLLAATLLAVGAPMLSMGDEVRRTQRGNNNAYCQDNELSWFDWTLLEQHVEVLRFVRELIRFRHEMGSHGLPARSLNQVLKDMRIEWHGTVLNQPDWSHSSHSLAVLFADARRTEAHFLILNAYWEPLEFELSRAFQGCPLAWRRRIDTALPSPEDIEPDPAAAVRIEGFRYRAAPRSVVWLSADL